uniref:G-protein coupled receptors family 3 profile domain-containing protein n=1 Tax=Amphora coffeiformis TaxID=265554 RepID=A0A7S3P7Q2_9STRA
MARRRATTTAIVLVATAASLLQQVFGREAQQSPASSLACHTDLECAAAWGPHSYCTDQQTCSNPLQAGCLATRLPGWTRPRVCGSQDPPNAAERGLCRPSPLGYTEVRMESNNDESTLFTTWILQVLLSEMLDVPVSIETSFFEYVTNFYDEHMRVEWGWANDERAVHTSSQVKDCVPLTQTLENYTACAHVIPFTFGSFRWTPPFVANRTYEPTQSAGLLGEEGWYVPRWTQDEYPELGYWKSYSGQQNRHKIAGIFKRPITWVQYCDWISNTTCATADDIVTAGYPQRADYWKFHVPGKFQGFFIDTEENNCTKYPTTCTGDFVDMPCGWSSYAEPALHHLNISLRGYGANGPPKGYWASQMYEIWHAANATRNHVIMQYFRPSLLYSEFMDTDFEMTRVDLPATTLQCEQNRRRDHDRCNPDLSLEERIGSPDGVCEEAPEVLQKVFSTALREITMGDHIPDALRSPAYDALVKFQISDLQVESLLRRWIQSGLDVRTSRVVVCDWIVENMDSVLYPFIPEGYPRKPAANPTTASTELYATSIAVAAIAIVASLLVSAFTYALRNKSSIVMAKHGFLGFILFGLILLSIGSMLTAVPPTDVNCIARVYFINIGYALELVPLVVRSAALNHVMTAGRQMRRVSLSRSELLVPTASITLVVFAILVVWTALDPATVSYDYSLSSSSSSENDMTVERSPYCGSGSNIWWIVSVSCQLFLLLIAGVLAFQNRNYHEDLADTRTLAMMIYSHIVFAILRAATYASDVEQVSSLAPHQSLIYSVDVLTCIMIYFLPKFFAEDRRRAGRNSVFLYTASRDGSSDGMRGSGHGLPRGSTHGLPNVVNRTPRGGGGGRSSLPRIRDFLRGTRSSNEERKTSGSPERAPGDSVEDGFSTLSSSHELNGRDSSDTLPVPTLIVRPEETIETSSNKAPQDSITATPVDEEVVDP